MKRSRSKSPFAARRARLMEAMGEGVAVFLSTPEASFGHDTHYRYRPDPDLHSLTGFAEPEAAAVLDADRKRFTLFVRPRDRARETWEGRRAGPEGVVRDLEADEAFPIAELEAKLAELVRPARVLWLALGASATADAIASRLLATFRKEARHPQRGPTAVKDPTDLLHEMRLVKTPEEIALMERAAAISARAHREAMAFARPGRYEYEVEAAVERRFKAEGASGPAYATIVASGENATILH
jgi:Xaa-Pro aminopeptidase